MPAFGVDPQDRIGIPYASPEMPLNTTGVGRAVEGFGAALEDAAKEANALEDARAMAELARRAAELDAGIDNSPTSEALKALRNGSSHDAMLNVFLGGLPEDVRERVAPDATRYAAARWTGAFDTTQRRVRAETVDDISGRMTDLATSGADLPEEDLIALGNGIRDSIERAGTVGIKTEALRARLDRTWQWVRVTKGLRFADADLTSRAPEARGRIVDAVKDLESFRAAYGPDMNETHWRRYASALDSVLDEEAREARMELRLRRAEQREARSAAEETLRLGITQLDQDVAKTVELLGQAPNAAVDWGGLKERQEALMADAARVAGLDSAYGRRVVELEDSLGRELDGYADAQAMLLSGPDGYKALREETQRLLADPDAAPETRRAYQRVAQQAATFVAREGPAAIVPGPKAPVGTPEASQQASITRSTYGGSGYTRVQAREFRDRVVTGSAEDAVTSLRGFYDNASAEQRAALAYELRDIEGGGTTADSVLYGLLGTTLDKGDLLAAKQGLTRLEQDEWVGSNRVLGELHGSKLEEISELFGTFLRGEIVPDAVALKGAIDAATALYVGRGGEIGDNFERDDWRKQFDRLFPGEEIVSVNGRRVLAPVDVDLARTLRRAGPELAAQYGNGTPDLGGETFEQFVDGARWLRVAPGKYMFAGYGDAPIRTTSDDVFVLDFGRLSKERVESVIEPVDASTPLVLTGEDRPRTNKLLDQLWAELTTPSAGRRVQAKPQAYERVDLVPTSKEAFKEAFWRSMQGGAVGPDEPLARIDLSPPRSRAEFKERFRASLSTAKNEPLARIDLSQEVEATLDALYRLLTAPGEPGRKGATKR